MTIGSKIFELRKKWNLSQEELAAKVNVSRQTVSKWENDVVLPDVYNLKELAKVFHCTVDELIDEEKEVSSKQDGPVVEAMKYTGKLAKRHWQKIGYYLLYISAGFFLFSLIVKMMDSSLGMGQTHHGETIFEMPSINLFNGLEKIPTYIAIITLVVGIGLIIYDFVKMKGTK